MHLVPVMRDREHIGNLYLDPKELVLYKTRNRKLYPLPNGKLDLRFRGNRIQTTSQKLIHETCIYLVQELASQKPEVIQGLSSPEVQSAPIVHEVEVPQQEVYEPNSHSSVEDDWRRAATERLRAKYTQNKGE